MTRPPTPHQAPPSTPAFVTRGVMLDVSRDRVPTMPELFRLVDFISAHGGNHLQLYTEHTFAYAGHEEAWRGCSPLTAEEIRALSVYAAGKGVQLAANQNCFGHLARWLRLPGYAHLAETHGDWMFDVWPRSGPFSLCPTDPASLEFVRDLLTQLIPCFAGRSIATPTLVNIGCDETYDVGSPSGRSHAEAQARGRAAVYADFVGKVCRVAQDLGARPMFWADIALHEPEMLARLPAELIALAWGYEPDTPFGAWCDAIHASGGPREVWVCPGTSSWRSITGRTRERRANLDAAARQGHAHGATGMLICEWGDTGHHQVWPVAAHALAEGLEAARLGHAPAPRTDPLSVWLDRLGDCDAHLRARSGRLARPELTGEFPLRNQSALFIDLHNHPHDRLTDVGRLEDWNRALAEIESLEAARPGTGDPLQDEELRFTVAYAALAARRAVQRRAPGGLSRRDADALIDEVQRLAAWHARLWPARSREGGLESSLSHFGKVITDLRRVK